MPVKTMPLSVDMLDGQEPEGFFGETLPRRVPPGKFYVIGRHYIKKGTGGGTLVLFQYRGAIVAYARLRAGWRKPNDDPQGHRDAVGIYLFEEIVVLPEPRSLGSLPKAWRDQWPRDRFDQYPRTLPDGATDEFLRSLKLGGTAEKEEDNGS